MENIIIGPDELKKGAVVPQCLDVHYVSDSTLDLLLSGKDYSDPEVVSTRRSESHREYRRSLLYSSQTVVNRAYFFNPLIYGDFEENFEDAANESNRAAFGRLIGQDRAIVPFVSLKADILEDAEASNLRISDRARRAVESLASIIHEIKCLRLSTNKKENELQTSRLAQFFKAFCRSLGEMDEALLNNFASEIYGGHQEVDLVGFRKALQQISRFEGSALTRTELYHALLCKPGTEHHLGQFKPLSTNPFVREQKKVIDLSYNSNLPDLIGRYLMSPIGLPPQAAIDLVIPHQSFASSDKASLLFEELQKKAAHTFMANMQQTFYLPAFSSLTISEVEKIRKLGEWEPFIQVQEKILEKPWQCLDLLEDYSNKLGAFQRAFSRWYYEKHPNEERKNAYGTFVGVTIKIGGSVFAAAVSHANPMLKLVSAVGPHLIPERVKLLVARLIVATVDRATGIPDPALSYSLDLLKSNVELTREDIRGLLEGFQGAQVPTTNAGTPDNAS